MGWAPDPLKERAAQDAQAEAQEAIQRRLDAEANKLMSPFERKLLGVVEDLRDAIRTPGPVLATCDPDTDHDQLLRIVGALPEGSVVTGPKGPILSVTPLAAAPVTAVLTVTDDGLARLADAGPTALGEAVAAAAHALADQFPALPGIGSVERVAEVAVEAALAAALSNLDTSAGQGEARGGATGGWETPPVDNPATP